MKGLNRVDKTRWFDIQEAVQHRETRANSTVQDGERTRKENVLNQEKANLEIQRNFYTVRKKSRVSRASINGQKRKREEKRTKTKIQL